MIRPLLNLSFIRELVCAAFLLTIVVTTTAFIGAPDVQAQQLSELEAKVSKVLDGDTFTLRGESRRIRICGLDAPEWDHRGGSAATETLPP